MRAAILILVAAGLAACAKPDVGTRLQGQVLDTNGQALVQAQVVFQRQPGMEGPRAVTVFTDAEGRFRFPDTYAGGEPGQGQLTARVLGYRQVEAIARQMAGADGAALVDTTLVLARDHNQAGVAPASAWLNRIASRAEKSAFVMNCIDCHQVPGPEQRAYAGAILDQNVTDPHVAQTQSWTAIVKYMNYLSSWEFSRGSRAEHEKVDAEAVYSVENGDDVVAAMTRYFPDRLDSMSGYSWGAPLLVNADTSIREYEIAHPNAVREALLLGDPQQLWVADVAANRMVSVDINTGREQTHEVPSDVLMSPHSLHRDHDGNLWVTPLFNSIVAFRNMKTGEWKTWRLKTPDGKSPGIHDLSFGYEHELLADDKGRIWFSDIGNNAVGYFDPADGSSRIWQAPASPGRNGRTALYGLSMTRDRKQVWYSQLGNGTFGGFDIEKQAFIGPFQLPDVNAGPRRISIGDDDVLYMALYGGGQLAAFDTRSRRMVGVYDLPDTGSAPYSTTWDDVRKVVWIATSNGDVIYRFDPRTREFGVLPLPREQAFLRMIDVDPRTGVLITSYANIVDIVQGPRMALIVDPGDGAYPGKLAIAPAHALVSDVPAATAASVVADGAKLFEEKRCYICHNMDDASLGPPLKAIAARHGSRRDVMQDVLASKIVHGGGGSWGVVPMVPNQWVSPAEAQILAGWILQL